MGQTMSYSLTQFEVDELIALSNGCCKLAPYQALIFPVNPRRWPGLSVPACVADIFLCCQLLAVTQAEIEALYKRFRSLDRGRKVNQRPFKTKEWRKLICRFLRRYSLLLI